MRKQILVSLALLALPALAMEPEEISQKTARSFKPKLLLIKKLLKATEAGDEEEVQRLLELGANPNIFWLKGKTTPLDFAASNGLTAICKLLLAAGCKVDPKDSSGCTPLLSAAQEGYPEICALLIANGADVNAKNHAGATALMKANRILSPDEEDQAAEKNAASAAMSTVLIAAGAKVNEWIWDDRGFPIDALTMALLRNTQLAELLLRAGADVLLYGVSGRHFIEIIVNYPELLNSIIFAPKAETLQLSQRCIKTALLCFRKHCPMMPRDIRHLLLSSVPELGNLIVLKRLHGEKTPCAFNNIAAQVLYDYSNERIDKKRLEHCEETFYLPARPPINKDLAIENIFARLAQPKFLCNNPSEVFRPDKKEHKCVVQ